jgi:predicted DNA-binding transcriptional regulator YafY
MNRTDRLLAMVLELQAKGWQRAEDLAERFEISKRTVYRDMQALSESGVPVVSVPGQGYSLVEGYFLPPLSFSSDEALMLLLGGDFMAQNFDADYRMAANTAVSKIEAVLDPKLRDEVNYLQRSLVFVATPSSRAAEMLPRIRRAIIQRHVVRFEYHSRIADDVGGSKTTRAANPYALLHVLNQWYMIAYCHLRHDIRHFRVDRIERLELERETYQRPDNFELQREQSPRTVTIRALFDEDVGRWVREEQAFYLVHLEEHDEGWLVTFKVRREEELFQWLLGWGAHVRVLEPESLRQRLVNEAQALLSKYQTS